MPIEARKKDKMLVSPPRMLGDREKRNPITPKIIATMARMIPVPGRTNKLAMADPMAMIEGILKWGLFCAIAGFIFRPFRGYIRVFQHTEDRKQSPNTRAEIIVKNQRPLRRFDGRLCWKTLHDGIWNIAVCEPPG
jgi:hypothetical protein